MVKKSARRTRRTHSPAFQARVALAALRKDKTMAELCPEFELHASQVIDWKRQLLDGAGDTTGTPWLARHPNYDQINAERPQIDADSVFHHVSGLPTFELRPYGVRVYLGNSA